MAWAYSGAWDGRGADELVHVLVSICNGVGDRYEACGMNRPEWATASGDKSETLVASDFQGVNLFSTDYWGLSCRRLRTLVSGITGAGYKDLYGFSKTATYSGDPRDNLWTTATIAADTGVASYTDIPTGSSSIFDQNIADLLREVMDRMLYPVIEIAGAGSTNTYSHEQWVVGTDAADAWANVVPTGLGSSGTIFENTLASISYNSGTGFYQATRKDESIVTVDSNGTENAAGVLGTVSDQWITYGYGGSGFLGGSGDVNGTSFAIPSGTTFPGVSGETQSIAFVPLSGNPTITISLSFSVEPPFNGTSGAVSGIGNVSFSIGEAIQIVNISSTLTDQS